MGSLISAIADDEDEYDALCKKYGEKRQGSPYSVHAHQLKERASREYRAEREAQFKAEQAPILMRKALQKLLDAIPDIRAAERPGALSAVREARKLLASK